MLALTIGSAACRREERPVAASRGEGADNRAPDSRLERLPRRARAADRLGRPSRARRDAGVRWRRVPRNARPCAAGDQPEHTVRVRRRPDRRDAARLGAVPRRADDRGLQPDGPRLQRRRQPRVRRGRRRAAAQNGGCHPTEGCFGGDGFDGASFDFLAANVAYKDSGETIFPPYAIHHFNGVKWASSE